MGYARFVGYPHQGDASISKEWFLQQGDASVPTPRPHHSRPYTTGNPGVVPMRFVSLVTLVALVAVVSLRERVLNKERTSDVGPIISP